MVAGVKQCGDRQMQRSHAAGGADGADPALQRGQPLFQHRGGRVRDPCIDVAGALEVEQRCGVFGILEHVRGGLIDRGTARAPVTGSGCCPACRLRVSKLGGFGAGMVTLRRWEAGRRGGANCDEALVGRTPYCAFPAPETMRGRLSWKRQTRVDARFRSLDDKIILINHSNIFEVPEKSRRSADDVTRLKYPWPNVAPRESVKLSGSDDADISCDRCLASASERRGSHADLAGAQRCGVGCGDQLSDPGRISVDGSSDLSGLANRIAEPARDRRQNRGCGAGRDSYRHRRADRLGGAGLLLPPQAGFHHVLYHALSRIHRGTLADSGLGELRGAAALSCRRRDDDGRHRFAAAGAQRAGIPSAWHLDPGRRHQPVHARRSD